MRIKWEPVYHEGGTEVIGSGANASTENVEVSKIIDLVQLHDGVLGAAAARRLDKKNYSWQDDVLDTTIEAGGIAVIESSAHTDAVQNLIEHPLFKPSVPQSGGLTIDPHEASLLEERPVDFLEIFKGFGELTARVHEAGLRVGEGIDRNNVTYGRTWHLDRIEDQAVSYTHLTLPTKRIV